MGELIKITALDKNILTQLFKNSRLPNSTIAKSCKTSKEVVNYRIKRLIEKNIITKFTPIIDYSKLGHHTYRIQLKLHSIPVDFEKKLLKKCEELPHISWVVDLSGPWDLALLFSCKGPIEFNISLRETIGLFNKLINKKQISIVTGIYHYAPSKITKGKIKPLVTSSSTENIKLHASEKAILTELLKDGRKPILELARDLKMSATNATHHLKQLQKKKIITGFRPIINYTEFGLDHFKVMISLRDPSQRKTCYEFIHQHLDIIYITESIGDFDVEFEAVEASFRELLSHIENIKEHVEIQHYEVILTKKEHAINLFPR